MAKNVMTPEGKAKIAAAQKARWDKVRAAKAAKPIATASPIAEEVPVEDLSEPMTHPGQVHALTECTGCGWKIEDKTWEEAITLHAKTTRCSAPCLIHPSKKFLKKRALKEMARTGIR